MKVAIIGVGAVGTSCAKSMLLRGSCHEIVLMDKLMDKKKVRRVQGVANDLSHGAPLCPSTNILVAKSFDDLVDVSIVAITAGINERTGGAIDPDDPLGRLRLLPKNALIYEKILRELVQVVPNATILVVTDPPDALADVARELTDPNKLILSTGTFLDSLRFRVQLARHFGCSPNSVDALVIGEHGKSQVYVWSSASIGGEPVLDRAVRGKMNVEEFCLGIESLVRDANIDIIKGTGASQHGIGIVTARIVEAILRDEGFIAPIGVFHKKYGATLSLPIAIGRNVMPGIIELALTEKEADLLEVSASILQMEVAKTLAQLGIKR